MTRKPDSPPKRPWIRGVVRGATGAMAMTGMRQAEVGLGFVKRTPPDAILKEGVPAVLKSVPKNRRKAAVELAHWGYGATAGALFTLLPRRLRRSWLAGPVYGVMAWGAFELVIAPALGLAHARRSRPQERAALLADHVVFGFVIGEPPEAEVAGTEGPEDARGGGDTEDTGDERGGGKRERRKHRERRRHGERRVRGERRQHGERREGGERGERRGRGEGGERSKHRERRGRGERREGGERRRS
ncbi:MULTISPECIES: hypothetical protein [Nocardiopsis]|uniref:hypothetical protein n=1 Tax=Nocardiopsis TaxID=2013 RepID=UPI0026A506CA|nr:MULTISPECIES: hypothetical protein [Nocardiopsis]